MNEPVICACGCGLRVLSPYNAYTGEVRRFRRGHHNRTPEARRRLSEKMGGAGTARIRAVCQEAGGNQAEAARRLGITRQRVHQVMKKAATEEQNHGPPRPCWRERGPP